MTRAIKIILILAVIFIPVAAFGAATTHYFADDGTDAGTCDATACTSSGSPCKTIECANEIIVDVDCGSNIYFKDDDTWDSAAKWGTAEYIRVASKSCTSGNELTIANWGSGTNYPIIDGMCDGSYPAVPAGGNACTGSPKPYSDGAGLILITESDYINVERIHFFDSRGRGIRAYTDNTYLTFDDVKVQRAHWPNIGISGNSTYTTVKNSEVWEGCWRWHQDAGKGSSGGAIQMFDAPYSTVINNEVYEIYCQAINLVRGSDNSVARYNAVWAGRSIDYYIDSASDCTIEYNLSLGTSDTQYDDSGGLQGTGYEVNMERPEHVNNSLIRNNVVIGRKRGYRMANQDGGSATNVRFYNNTCIDATPCIRQSASVNSAWSYSVKNNLFWQSSDQDMVGSTEPNADTYDYNYWSHLDEITGTNYAGTNDQDGGTVPFSKSSNWQSVANLAAISMSDLALQSGSDPINNADDLGDAFRDAINQTGTNFMTNPTIVALLNQDLHGTGWEMGAFGLVEDEPPEPPPPSDLKIQLYGDLYLYGQWMPSTFSRTLRIGQEILTP
jgi:hypothetical protein